MDFRDLSNVQLNNDNVQAFDTKRDEVPSAVTERPTDSMLERLCRMQTASSEELKNVLQVSLHSRDDILGQDIRLLQIGVDDPKTS